MLRCLLRHKIFLAYGETLCVARCRRCGYVESQWPVWRPWAGGAARAVLEQEQAETQARAAAERVRLFADRERRAAAMGQERRLKLVGR